MLWQPKAQDTQLGSHGGRGVRFETFYAMPLCTPTRVALMTGQYGFHNGFLVGQPGLQAGSGVTPGIDR